MHRCLQSRFIYFQVLSCDLPQFQSLQEIGIMSVVSSCQYSKAFEAPLDDVDTIVPYMQSNVSSMINVIILKQCNQQSVISNLFVSFMLSSSRGWKQRFLLRIVWTIIPRLLHSLPILKFQLLLEILCI